MPDTLIVNARLVNEGREFDADLRISGARIAEIGSGLAAREGERVVDADGRRLLPGMIDDQVHFREPGMEYKADIASESAAAVAGGLTSFMDMPNTRPPTLDADALEDKYRRATGRARANFGFYMGAFKVAADANLPVVPGALRGVRTLLRGDQWFPRRTPIAVEIAAPIQPTGTDFSAMLALRDKARAAMLARVGEPDLGGLERPAGAPN